MASSPRLFYVLGLLVLVFGLTACALPRNGNNNSDLQPLEAMPPTLAPLGAESADLAAEATIVPTVINVQPTATGSPLGEGEAAAASGETLPATVQPILVPATPIAEDVQQVGQAAAPEVSASDEPIVVDATTQSAPADEPIAANPPVSDTGNYETTGYGEAAYTVQAGDTLFSIAQRHGSTVEAIVAANGLSSDILHAGQVLTVPAGGESYAAPAAPAAPAFADGSGGQHTVGGGETLFRIAMNYGTTVEAIAGANGIPYPYTIFPGQQLVIPSGGDYYPQPMQPPGEDYYPQPMQPPFDGNYPAYPYPPQDQGYYPMPDNETMMPGMGGTHTVAPGETLHSIAQRYGTSAQAIANANGLMNPNQIYVGQVIYLP